MRIYDHSDAQAYEENLIEYAQEDDPANRDQYEFPEVEKALPECIRGSLKHESEHWRLDYRRLLSRHRNGPIPELDSARRDDCEACHESKRDRLNAADYRRVLRWTAAAGAVDCLRGA